VRLRQAGGAQRRSDGVVVASQRLIDLAYQQAKDRNEGREPDSLHVEYELERMRLLAENDHLLLIVNQWNVGAPAARRARQEQLRVWWPALGQLLDTATEIIRGEKSERAEK